MISIDNHQSLFNLFTHFVRTKLNAFCNLYLLDNSVICIFNPSQNKFLSFFFGVGGRRRLQR